MRARTAALSPGMSRAYKPSLQTPMNPVCEAAKDQSKRSAASAAAEVKEARRQKQFP